MIVMPIYEENVPLKRPLRRVKLSLRLTEGEALRLKEMTRLGGFRCQTAFIKFQVFSAPQYIRVIKAMKEFTSEALRL